MARKKSGNDEDAPAVSPLNDEETAASPEKKKGKADKPAVGKMAALAGVVQKAFKEKVGKVDLDMQARKKPHPHIPTGSIIVDWLIGGQPNDFGVPPCPGLPKGRLVNLYGMESSGKTTLALTTAATTIQNGGRVCFIDWEHAIDLRYAASLGVPQDEEKFFLVQPTDLETGMGIAYVMAKGGIDLIIIDSVGAGVPKKLMEQSISEIGEVGRVGIMAQKWGAFLPKLKEAIAKSGSSVIGISQMRDKIDTGGGRPSYGGPQKQAQGGNAWKFYSELRMMLVRVKQEKGKLYSALENKWIEGVVGNVIKAKIDKCKVAPTQGATAEFFIRYGEGIDDVRSIIEVAVAHGVIKKAGAWYTLQDGTRANGAEALRKMIISAPGAWEALYTATLEKMASNATAGIVSTEDSDEEDDLDLAEIGFLTGDEEGSPASDDDEGVLEEDMD